MAIVYISPAGNDSTGNGTSGNPWQTISKAVSSTSSGDTINCLAGTYTWSSQTFSTPRNVVGVSGAAAAIFDAGAAHPLWTNSIVGGTLTITGLTFQNWTTSGTFTPAFTNSNSNAVGSTATTAFVNCIFSGITCTNSSSSDSGLFELSQFSTSVGTMTFSGCLFNGCDVNDTGGHSGLYNPGGNSSPGVLTMINCTLYSGAGSNAAIIADTGGVMTITLTNCIFFNATGSNPQFDTIGNSDTILGSNNLVRGYSNIPTSLSSQTGYLTSDPLFVDAGNSNFNLRPTSPCIDAGTPI